MSQHNVEVVRRGYEALARGDIAALAALLEQSLDPEFEYQSELAGEAFRDVEGMRDFLVELRETFQNYTIEVDETFDSGEHVVVGPVSGGGEPEVARPSNGGSTSCGPSTARS